MKSSEIKVGELLLYTEDNESITFGVVYHKDDEGFYLVDWTDGFASGEHYTEADISKWRMTRTSYEPEYQGG